MSTKGRSGARSDRPSGESPTFEGPGELTALLRAWGRGDVHARDELLPLVYEELRRRAAAYLRRERADHTLQPTALIHEAYLRLVGQERVAWQNRAQFFGLAAQMMRRILIDHARARRAAKRPAGAMKVTLDEDERIGQTDPADCDVLLLNQALDELSSFQQVASIKRGPLSSSAGHDVRPQACASILQAPSRFANV